MAERKTGLFDFDEKIREKAASIGAGIVEGGPGQIFEEIEELLPQQWRDQIASFPMAALVLGFGVGVFLGAKKGDELIAAGSALVTAAVAANLNNVLGEQGR